MIFLISSILFEGASSILEEANIISKYPTGPIFITVVSYDICATVGRVCACLLVPCALFSSLLFLIRVLAVFHHSRVAQFVFIFLWLGYIALSIILPFMLSFTFSAVYRPMCLLNMATGFETFGIGYDIGYHTLILLATSMRLLSCSLADSWSGKLQVFLGGEGIPRLSRFLVRTDQLYYL